MKINILAAMLALTGTFAQAAEINCSITRTNKYNDSDVATHQYKDCFDGRSRWGVMAAGTVRSFLIPSNAQVNYSFGFVGQSGETELVLTSYATDTGDVVSNAYEYGSPASAPAMVSNSFDAGKYTYTIDCDLSN